MLAGILGVEILLLGYGTIIFQGEAGYLFEVYFLKMGLTPFVDFTVPQSPLYLGAYFPVGNLGDQGIWAARLLSSFYLAVAIAFCYRIAVITGGEKAGLCYLGLQILVPTSLSYLASLIGPYVISLLCMTIATWAIIEPRLSRKPAFIIFGFFSVFAAASRIVFLVPMCLAAFAFVCLNRPKIKECAWALLGMAGACIAILALIPLSDLGLVFHGVIGYHFQYKVAHPIEVNGELGRTSITIATRLLHIFYTAILPILGFLLLAISSVFAKDGQKKMWIIPFAAAFGIVIGHMPVNPFLHQYLSMAIPLLLAVSAAGLVYLLSNHKILLVVLILITQSYVVTEFKIARSQFSLGTSQVAITENIGKQLREIYAGTPSILCDVNAFAWEAGLLVPIGTERGLSTHWLMNHQKVAEIDPSLETKMKWATRDEIENAIIASKYDGIVITSTHLWDDEIKDAISRGGYKRVATLNGGRWGVIWCFKREKTINS